MLVFFLIIGYNVNEHFNDHPFIKTFNQGCVRGFYCPKDTDYAKKCKQGHYCPDGKLHTPCKEGSFCPGNLSGIVGDGTPSRSYNEQICPNGYYCPSRGLLNGTMAKPCSSGKVCCYRGETDSELLSGNCKTREELNKAIEDNITFAGSKGWAARSSEKVCPGGYYCPVDADGNSDGTIWECQDGDYCPAGSIQPYDCPAGFYCPPKNSVFGNTIYGSKKIKCTIDEIDVRTNASKGCKEDVNGIEKCAPYCPIRSSSTRYCKKGHMCPFITNPITKEKIYGTVENKCGEEMINGIKGWKGVFKDKLKADGSPELDVNGNRKKIPDRGGKYQKYKGSLSCMECSPGVSSNQTTREKCQGCPAGHYCPDLETNPKICKPGSYVHKTFACEDGQSCIGGDKTDIDSGSAQYPNKCFDCPPGNYQDKSGSFQCLACPPGTAQPLAGQTKCDDCIGGRYQDREGSAQCKECEKGHYCSDCISQTTERGCSIQDCYWNPDTSVCYPKRKIKDIVEEIDPNEWVSLGLIPINGTKYDVIKLIQKLRTISKTTKERKLTLIDKTKMSSDKYLKISKYFKDKNISLF